MYKRQSENNTAKVWNAANGQQITELRGQRNLKLDLAGKERQLAFAKREVTYHTNNLKVKTDEQKKADDRLKKADEAKKKAEAAPIAEKKKILDTANAEKKTNEDKYNKLKADYDTEVKTFTDADAVAKTAEATAAKAKTDAAKPVADLVAKDKDAVLANIEKIEAREESLQEKADGMPRAARYTLPITQRQYNGYTTATPITDGRLVWTVFGNRVATCFDMEGKRKWSRVLPDNPQMMWGHSASPLLVAGRLIVPIEDIVALDPETGKELWRTSYGQTWGSPVRAEIDGKPLILMANGRMVRPRDGKVIGRLSPLERSSPVVVGSTAFYIGQRAEAFPLPERLDPKAKKRLRPKALWESSPPGGGFSSSPVVHDGLIYCVATRGILSVLDTKTGKTVYTRRLNLGNGPVWPSLLHAGDHVYVSNRDGNTVVFKTGRKYQEVARNHLEEFISTPVLSLIHI